MKAVKHDRLQTKSPEASRTNEPSDALSATAYEPPRLEDFGQLRALIRGVTGEGVDFAQLAFE